MHAVGTGSTVKKKQRALKIAVSLLIWILELPESVPPCETGRDYRALLDHAENCLNRVVLPPTIVNREVATTKLSGKTAAPTSTSSNISGVCGTPAKMPRMSPEDRDTTGWKKKLVIKGPSKATLAIRTACSSSAQRAGPTSVTGTTLDQYLPPGWVAVESKDTPGIYYYWKENTEITQWEHPGMSQAPPVGNFTERRCDPQTHQEFDWCLLCGCWAVSGHVGSKGHLDNAALFSGGS